MGHGKGSWFLSSVLIALLLSVSAGKAQESAVERPLSVVYGPKALAQEGDDDHREEILLSVPAGTSDKLYVRVFDPDLGGDHDLVYGKPDTEARFMVYGRGDAPLMTRRFGADLPDTWPEKAKQARFLQYRGFSGDQIRAALGPDFDPDC